MIRSKFTLVCILLIFAALNAFAVFNPDLMAAPVERELLTQYEFTVSAPSTGVSVTQSLLPAFSQALGDLKEVLEHYTPVGVKYANKVVENEASGSVKMSVDLWVMGIYGNLLSRVKNVTIHDDSLVENCQAGYSPIRIDFDLTDSSAMISKNLSLLELDLCFRELAAHAGKSADLNVIVTAYTADGNNPSMVVSAMLKRIIRKQPAALSRALEEVILEKAKSL